MKTPLLLALLGTLAGCAGLNGPVAGDASVQRLVAEDDQIRIDELRVRGQTQRITVSPKGGSAPAYDIVTPAAGSDPSKSRDGAGQSVWQVLTF
jgi:hypothetical protein